MRSIEITVCVSKEGFTTTLDTGQAGNKDQQLIPMSLRHWLETVVFTPMAGDCCLYANG